MNTDRIRRFAGFAGIVALTGVLAACASQQQSAPPPPMQQEAPPPPAPPPPEAMPAPPPGPPRAAAMGLVVAARVHLHAGPSLRTRVVATLRPGTPVQPTGQRRGIWREIETPAGTGWVEARFVRPA